METKPASQFERGYVFREPEIKAALMPEYLAFLKEGGIVDLERTPNLFVAGSLLSKDKRVEDTIRTKGIKCAYAGDGTVVNISQPYARKLVHGLDGVVMPVGIAYRLVIPALKEAAKESNESARETLAQMTDDYVEWLEDLVLDRTRLRIGTQERTIALPDKDGRFDRQNISELGYPNSVKGKGEFYYYFPREDERAAIRNRGSELNLLLNGEPSLVDGRLGVRFAKFFS